MVETKTMRAPTEREAAVIAALFGEANGNFTKAVQMVTGARFSSQVAHKIKNSAPVRAAVREVFDSVGLTGEVLFLKLMQLMTAKISKYNKATECFEEFDDNATQIKALMLCIE